MVGSGGAGDELLSGVEGLLEGVVLGGEVVEQVKKQSFDPSQGLLLMSASSHPNRCRSWPGHSAPFPWFLWQKAQSQLTTLNPPAYKIQGQLVRCVTFLSAQSASLLSATEKNPQESRSGPRVAG